MLLWLSWVRKESSEQDEILLHLPEAFPFTPCWWQLLSSALAPTCTSLLFLVVRLEVEIPWEAGARVPVREDCLPWALFSALL